MSLYLLDTNACVQLLNTRSSLVEANMRTVGDASIVLCSVVAGELFYGASKSNNPAKMWAIAERFVNRFRSYAFDEAAAKHYGVIRSELERNGIVIGANDLLIASIAVTNSLILVTNNTSEFQRVRNLQIVDWQTTGPTS